MRNLCLMVLLAASCMNSFGQQLPQSPKPNNDALLWRKKAKNTRNAAIILGSAGIALITASSISGASHDENTEPTGFEAATGVAGVLSLMAAIPFIPISVHYGRLAKRATISMGTQMNPYIRPGGTIAKTEAAAIDLVIPLHR